MVIRCEINSCPQLWLPSSPHSCRSFWGTGAGECQLHAPAKPRMTRPGGRHEQANLCRAEGRQQALNQSQGGRVELASCQPITVTRKWSPACSANGQPAEPCSCPGNNSESQAPDITGEWTLRSLTNHCVVHLKLCYIVGRLQVNKKIKIKKPLIL